VNRLNKWNCLPFSSLFLDHDLVPTSLRNTSVLCFSCFVKYKKSSVNCDNMFCSILSLYTVYSLMYTVYNLLYTFYSLLYAVYSLLYTVYSLLYTVYSLLYTVYSRLYRVYSLLYTVYSLLYTVYIWCLLVISCVLSEKYSTELLTVLYVIDLLEALLIFKSFADI